MCDRGLEYIWIRCEMPRLEKEVAAGKARSAIALFGGLNLFWGDRLGRRERGCPAERSRRWGWGSSFLIFGGSEYKRGIY